MKRNLMNELKEEIDELEKHKEFVKELSTLKELTKEFDVEININDRIIKMMQEAVEKVKNETKSNE